MMEYYGVCGRYNLIKMTVLQLLEYQRRSEGGSWLQSSDIARLLKMTAKERASLYVLLSRWADWKLIDQRRRTMPGDRIRSRLPSGYLEYRLTKRGKRWLKLIPRTELRNGLPPRKISQVVAKLAGVAIWWGWYNHGRNDEYRPGQAYDQTLIIKPPFWEAEDFTQLDPESKYRHMPDTSLILPGYGMILQVEGAWEAVNMAEQCFGFTLGREFLDKVIAGNVGLERKTKGETEE